MSVRWLGIYGSDSKFLRSKDGHCKIELVLRTHKKTCKLVASKKA